jgi:nucleotide-binding universal stress UspA family protein
MVVAAALFGHTLCKALGGGCVMTRFRTVVAAVDFSDSAADALDAAMALIDADPSARLHLLHVLPDPVPQLWSDEMPQVDLRSVERAWREGASKQLAALVAARALPPDRVVTAVAVGAAADQIARYADAHAADAVVLGSHGHGRVRRFLLGSVADRLVRIAPCAVLIVPHRTLRDAAPTATSGASTQAS